MFNHPVYYIALSIILLVLIVLLVRMIIQRRKEDKIFREYMAKMDELRKLKNEVEANSQNQYRTYREKQEAERRAPANPQREMYYTTYNEREEELVKTPNARNKIDVNPMHRPEIPERKIPDWMIYVAIAILAIIMYKNGIRLL